jgi:hypothetical protein
VAAGDAIELDSSGSIAPQGCEFHWSVSSDDAVVEPASGPKVRFSAERAGTYRVELRVRPPGGASPDVAEAVAVVTVTRPVTAGATADDRYWRDVQIERRRKALDDVRASAARWDASITGFLAVFGLAAFVAGPKTIDAVSSEGLVRLGLVVIASSFLLILTARWLVATVGGGTPVLGPAVEPLVYAQRAWFAAARGASRLKDARWLALIAAVMLATASLLVAAATLGPEAASPPMVLVREDGDTRCGELTTSADGAVAVGGDDLAATLDVIPMTSCNVDAGGTAASPDKSDAGAVVLATILAALSVVAGWYFSVRHRWHAPWFRPVGLLLVSSVLCFGGMVVAGTLTDAGFDLDETWYVPAMVVAGLTVGSTVVCVWRATRPPPSAAAAPG